MGPHLPGSCIRIYGWTLAHRQNRDRQGTGCLYGRLPQPDQPPHAGCQRGHCRRDTFHHLEPYLYTRADERREGSAQMFGEIFRNIFGWHVMRPSAMDKELFNDLYRMYIKDENKLGIHEYFLRVNPAAFQAMTAVMLESARKGYWKASDKQLKTTASLHAQITREKGAACTEFVCDNAKLNRSLPTSWTIARSRPIPRT